MACQHDVMELRAAHYVDGQVQPTSTVRVTSATNGHLTTINIGVEAAQSVSGGTIELELPYVAMRFLEQGFQSWSVVRRTTPGDIRPVRAEAPRWFRGQMLADRDGAGVELAGDGYLVFDGGVIGFLRASTSFGTIKVARDGSLRAVWLLDELALEAGQTLQLDPLLIALGDPGAMYDEYAELSGRASGARAPKRSPRIWCSWYQYFTAITPPIIRQNLALAAAHGVEVFQIDDGWQAEIGVWNDTGLAWDVPMSQLADEIRKAGCTPGIWTAPFLAIEGGTIANEHPEWLVTNERGEPTTALFHGGWGGKIFALDTTRDDVIAHITNTFAQLRRDGFDYFKIDFLHAASAIGNRSEAVTRAQALRRGLAAVRAGIGEDAYLLGCGSPLLSAVGFVDAMRVSEDVAPFFEPREFFPGFEENTVAARNAVEATLLRAPLHRRWFAVDPDCVLVRPVETDLTEVERLVVRETALASSGFIALSDDLSLYDDSIWTLVDDLYREAEAIEGTRSLPDPFAIPLPVTTPGGTFVLGWDPASSARE